MEEEDLKFFRNTIFHIARDPDLSPQDVGELIQKQLIDFRKRTIEDIINEIKTFNLKDFMENENYGR